MKIQIYCETENCFVNKETLLVVEKCPNNANHTIRQGSMCIIETSDEYEKDYKRLRTELYTYVSSIGFSNLSEEEKKIAVKNFVVGKNDRDTVYTLAEQIEYGKIFHKKSTEAREQRFFKGIVELYNRLTYEQIQILVEETQHLVFKYINYGIEGTDVGDVEGLWDYIQAKTGTSFETTGLPTKNWTPIGCTMQELVQKLMNILLYGNIEGN